MPHFILKLTLILLVASIVSCSFDDSGMPPLEPFSKREQERIGNRIHFAVLAASGYDLVPQVPPFDTTLVALTNSWYSQLTLGIQKDLSSPSANRWDKDREWIVTLIDNPDEIAVAAPGGYLYLSTGLLRALDREDQLFFVMALEAAAARGDFAMNKLISRFGTDPLRRLARGVQGATVPPAQDLAEWLFSLDYTPNEIDRLDESAADLMCSSSVYSPSSLTQVLNELSDSGWWKTHRNYPQRGEGWDEREFPGCGTRTTVGAYSQRIKPFLP